MICVWTDLVLHPMCFCKLLLVCIHMTMQSGCMTCRSLSNVVRSNLLPGLQNTTIEYMYECPCVCGQAPFWGRSTRQAGLREHRMWASTVFGCSSSRGAGRCEERAGVQSLTKLMIYTMAKNDQHQVQTAFTSNWILPWGGLLNTCCCTDHQPIQTHKPSTWPASNKITNMPSQWGIQTSNNLGRQQVITRRGAGSATQGSRKHGDEWKYQAN